MQHRGSARSNLLAVAAGAGQQTYTRLGRACTPLCLAAFPSTQPRCSSCSRWCSMSPCASPPSLKSHMSSKTCCSGCWLRSVISLGGTLESPTLLPIACQHTPCHCTALHCTSHTQKEKERKVSAFLAIITGASRWNQMQPHASSYTNCSSCCFTVLLRFCKYAWYDCKGTLPH